MTGRLRSFLLTLALLAGVMPAAAVAQEGPNVCVPGVGPATIKGPVTFECNVPNTAVISAEFALTGDFFYVSSTDSVDVYSYSFVDGVPHIASRGALSDLDDISPIDLGFPIGSGVTSINFENESMTYGERRGPDGSVSARFVILAIDLIEATPRDQETHLGGDSFAIIDVTDPDSPFVRSRGEALGTHTIQCISRRDCDFAYSSGDDGEFGIIDLRDLDNPTQVGTSPTPAGGPNDVFTSGAGHYWDFDEAGIGWHTGSGGAAAFDLTDPTNPSLLAQTNRAGVTTPLNDFILHNSNRRFATAFDGSRAVNEPNLAKGNVLVVTEEDYANEGDEVACDRAGLLETWYVPDLNGDQPNTAAAGSGKIRPLDSINAPLEAGVPATAFCSAHWFDVHQAGFVAQGFYQGGFHVTDVRDPLDIKVYGSSFGGASEVWDAYWFPERDASGVDTGRKKDVAITADFVRGLDVFSVDLPFPDIQPQPSGADGVNRTGGNDRVQTSVNVVKSAFESAEFAILARSDLYPDALAASTLAAELNAPLLLTPSGGLDAAVGDELERLGVDTAYLMGGNAALAPKVEQDLSARQINNVRVGGADRFETAANIARQVVRLGGPVDQAIVALGNRPARPSDAWPDALASSNLATTGRAPLLLALPDSVPAASRAALDEILDGGDPVFVAGGVNAISAAASAPLEADYAVTRLAGADRYATAIEVSKEAVKQGMDLEPTLITSGTVFADSLGAGPAAYHLGGGLLLTNPGQLPATVDGYLRANRAEIDTAIIVGGRNAISEKVENEVREAIKD